MITDNFAQDSTSDHVGTFAASNENFHFRQTAISILLLLLAISCIVALGAWTGLTVSATFATLISAPIWLIPSIVSLTVLQVALSALKWRLVLDRLYSETKTTISTPFCYHATSLAAFLSQFLTVYLASILVRGWAVRGKFGISASTGAISSLYEQVFDVIVLVVLVLPAIIVWSMGGEFAEWVWLTIGFILLGGLSLQLLRPSNHILLAVNAVLPRANRLTMIFEQSAAAGLLSKSFTLRIYSISVIRYFSIMLRAPLLIAALGLPIALTDAVPGFTIVQATQIAAITPGQLGIREWSWSGVLGLRGYDLQLAAQFAIDLRIISLVAMTLTALPSFIATRRKWK